MKKISKMPQKLIITATMLATIIGAFTGCSTAKPAATSKSGGAAQRQMSVVTQIVKLSDVGGGQLFTGSVTPAFTTNVSSKISGKVLALMVNVGDRITTGQPLAKVDTTSLEQQIAQSQSAASLSEVQLNRAKNDQANALSTAEKNFNSQQAQYDKTVSDQQNAIAVAKQAVAVSQAQLDNAVNTQQNTIATAKQGLTTAQVAFTKAVNDNGATLTNAQNTLSFQQDNLQTSSLNSLQTLQANLQQANSAYQIAINNYNSNSSASNQSAIDAAVSKLQTAQSALDQAQQTPLSNLSTNMKSLLDAQAVLTAAQNSQAVQVAQESLNQQLTALANAQAVTTDVNQQQLQQNQLALTNAQTAAQSTVNTSKAQLDVSQQALQTAKSMDAIKVSEAQYQQAQTNLQVLSDQLKDGTILSPVDGVVSAINTPVGQNAGGQTTVLSVVAVDSTHATVNISESNIGKIKVGMAMIVNIPTLKKSYTGQVLTIQPTLDPITKSYGVDIKINDPLQEVLPGMFATSSLTSEGRKAIMIPADAVLSQPSGNAVFIVKNGKAQKVPVNTGLLTSALFEIVSGLNEGDELVIQGQELLSDKVAVQVLQPGQDPAQASGKAPQGANGQQGQGSQGKPGDTPQTSNKPQTDNTPQTDKPQADPTQGDATKGNQQTKRPQNSGQQGHQASPAPSDTNNQAPRAGGGQ